MTRYAADGPSSRVRSYQLLALMADLGFKCSTSPLLPDGYVRDRYCGHFSLKKVVFGYFRRWLELLLGPVPDVYVVEKELFPWIPFPIERWFWPKKVPVIVDFDDAIFHYYDQGNSLKRLILGRKIEMVMKCAAHVTAGNRYLAAQARRIGAPVTIVRSSIDGSRYSHSGIEPSTRFTIGWIGSPVTAKFLDDVAESLQWAIQHLNARVLLIGSGPHNLESLGAEVIPWSIETEVALISTIDVGIMPLTDSPFERGKCGYKLIQYMACGKPVIASPVGINREIVDNDWNGYLATTTNEWKVAFAQIAQNCTEAARMGIRGRDLVFTEYTSEIAARKLATVIRAYTSKLENSSA